MDLIFYCGNLKRVWETPQKPVLLYSHLTGYTCGECFSSHTMKASVFLNSALLRLNSR